MTEKKRFSAYSLGEEIGNAVSHGVGSLLAIAGTAVLLVFTAMSSDTIALVSAALYGASLIVLYTNSTLYHSITNARAKSVFRVFDHCSIFFLILGTYIPVSLALLRGWMGWTLFGINVGCAVIGIVFNSIDLERFKKLSMLLYLIMGWSVIFTAYPVWQALAPKGIGGVLLLFGGGVFYTVGVAFYKSKRAYMHFVWHFFVLAGSVLHYFFVMFYCI